jgi:hypothetical protein
MGQLVTPDQVAGLAASLISQEFGVMTGAQVDYDRMFRGRIWSSLVYET